MRQFRCSVCGADLGWDVPSGVCSPECLHRAQFDPPAAQPRFHLRWQIRRDMTEVLEIDALSFTTPWTEEAFLEALRQRSVIGQVVEVGVRVVGYMIYRLHRDSLELHRLAVHPEFRRRGCGSLMLRKLRSKLTSHNRCRIDTIVPESALPMQLLLRAHGFLATKVLRGWCGDEDAFDFSHSGREAACSGR